MLFGRWFSRLALCAYLSAATLVSALPARGADAPTEDKRVEAKKHFHRGVELYEEQDFRGALAEFERAYELAPSYKVLYNIGQANFQLQSYPKALDALDLYLERGGAEIPAARRKEVEESRAKLRARIATLEIRSNVEAAFAIDDVPVGTGRATSLRIRLGAGPHVVIAEADGYVGARKTVTLTGEDETRVDLDLQRITIVPPAGLGADPQVPARARGADAAAARTESSKVPAYAALGTTALLATGAVAFGISSLSARSSLEETLATRATGEAIESARSRLVTMTVLTDVLSASALVGAVVTTVLFATRKSSPRTAAAASATTWELTLSPTFLGSRGSF